MRVEFSEFFDSLINKGKFNPGLKYGDCDLKHSFPAPAYANRLHDILCNNESDTIEFEGALFSVMGGNLVSTKPFNVTGFIGDMDSFDAEARKSMANDITCFKNVLKAWEDVKSFHNSMSSFAALDLRGQDFGLTGFAERLVSGWVDDAYNYIEQNLAYNLIDNNGFERHRTDVVCEQVFGMVDFSGFDSVEKLEKLPDAICFNKMKDWVASNFDEDMANKAMFGGAARGLCDEFVNKTIHKAFDKYKLKYWVSSYSWESKTIDKQEFKDWFNNLRIACFEQDSIDWYNSFSFDCAVKFKDLSAGDEIVCGGVSIRVYKSHITLSLPKKVSMAIGVFINKYASDTLKRKVA